MKKEKGITLVALVVTIIVLLILSGVTIAMLSGQNGILTQAQNAKKATEDAAKEEDSLLSSLEDYMISDGSYNKETGVNEPRILSGMKEVMFTEPTSTEKGQTIKRGENGFDESNWYSYKDTKWANAVTEDGSYWVWIPRFAYKMTYKNASDKSQGGTIEVKFLIGTTDEYYTDDTNTTRATAKRATSKDEEVDTTKDFYVHPAFTNESSIDYANGGWDKELTGIWVAKFEAGYASGNNSAEVKASSVNYSQQTAWVYQTEAEPEANNSGSTRQARNWLDGVYATRTLNADGKTYTYSWKNGQQTAIKYPTFQPKTYSMNYININDAYNISKALTEKGNIYGLSNSTTDSHLMKNSEWGAVAYLAQSAYGNNGTEPSVNNVNLNSGDRLRTDESGQSGVDSVYAVTGVTRSGGSGTATVDNINSTTGNTASNGVYTWDQLTGQKSSSTLNMYGVYDMSGGTWERTAGYTANGNWNLVGFGASLTDSRKRTTSTKYVTVYPHDADDKDNTTTKIDDLSQANHKANKYIYGDGIRETSTSATTTDGRAWYVSSWNSDYSYFPALDSPFTLRGGYFWNGSSAGLFAFGRTAGASGFSDGFRPVLVAL